MLIRCSKESHHPAEWAQGLRLSIRRTRKTQCWRPLMWGQNITVYVRSPTLSHPQTLSNPFRTLTIKIEVHIFIKKSSCVFIIVSLWCCRWQYNKGIHRRTFQLGCLNSVWWWWYRKQINIFRSGVWNSRAQEDHYILGKETAGQSWNRARCGLHQL